MGQSSQPHELGGGLKSRHVTMLSIAGVIGASLFVGSSVAIAEAGPAVLLAYLFAGLLVVMIMRMLAELAVATPDTGSFSILDSTLSNLSCIVMLFGLPACFCHPSYLEPSYSSTNLILRIDSPLNQFIMSVYIIRYN